MHKLLALFRIPTPLSLAELELAEAQRSHLKALTAVEYATAICSYQDARVKRLRAYVARETVAKMEAE